jgi:SAM-dependent methyltransferase
MDYEPYITEYYSDLLTEIDKKCADEGIKDLYPVLRPITDVALWNVLLWKHYTKYDNLRNALPGFPEVSLQKRWAGVAGMELGANALLLYRNLHDQIRQYSLVPLARARFLDFGCGWGNVARYFLKDLPSEQIFGCDPHAEIIELASRLIPYVTFERSEILPKRLPFDGSFDIVIAISIWTHLTEKASEACLDAIHQSLRPGGLFLLTIRPPVPELYPEGNVDDVKRVIAEHGFCCHANAYAVDGESTYGWTVITMKYIRSHWTDRFEILDTTLFSPTPGQLLVTLRRVD